MILQSYVYWNESWSDSEVLADKPDIFRKITMELKCGSFNTMEPRFPLFTKLANLYIALYEISWKIVPCDS